MTSKFPPRLFSQFSKHARRRYDCQNCSSPLLPTPLSSQTRHASSFSPISDSEMEVDRASRPRWQYTPPLMKAPISARLKKPGNEIKINHDPVKLDQVYTKLLGENGDKMLSEEVKWLAVTHKSFDHGRRGFNDRLAYLGVLKGRWKWQEESGLLIGATGRRIIELQTSLALVQTSSGVPIPPVNDPYRRIPFHHPALDGLESLTQSAKDMVLDKKEVSRLAEQYGLQDVIRWKPKKADNLTGSGLEVVLTQAVYAIVGAIALERGGEAANKVVRERILNPLGLGLGRP